VDNIKTIITIFLFLILIESVYALGNLAITVNSNKVSLNLIHGQSETITFTVDHDNNFCSVSCEYFFYNWDTNQLIDAGTEEVSVIGQLSKTYTLKAPSKQEGGISGQNKYLFRAECQDTGFLCFTDATDTEDSPLITLNYDLSATEKSAKQYVDNYLTNIQSDLDESEKKLFNIETKFNELPNNIKISDLKSTFNSLDSSFNSNKGKYDSLKSSYDNLDFINAKSTLESSSLLTSSDLKNNIVKLDTDLQNRIDLHNKVANKITELSNELNKLSKDVTILKETTTFNSIKKMIDDLSGRFNSGTFESYESVEGEISPIDDKIKNFQQRLKTKKDELIGNIINILENEKSRVCSIKNYCTLNLNIIKSQNFVTSVNNLCDSSIVRLKEAFDNANQQDYGIYTENLTIVDETNKIISQKNQKIQELNSIVKSLFDLINKNNLELNIEECNEEFSKTIQSYALENTELNFIDTGINKCNELKNTATDEVSVKESSFFFKIKRFFINIFTPDKLKFQPIEEITLLEIPKEPTFIELIQDVKDFSKTYCDVDLSLAPLSQIKISVAQAKGKTLGTTSIQDTVEHQSQCKVFGVIRPCCEDNECRNDKKSFPIIFLHGHSFQLADSPQYSLDAFNKIRDSLIEEGYLIGGTILPTSEYGDVPQGDWGKSGAPVTIKVTYYYGVYNEQGRVINKPSKSESISTYAKRINDIIELIKYRTGRDQVNIIAHSMGGLVSREYIRQFGSDSVYKLIMIGTPNHGIYGQVADSCSFFGAGTECAEMESTSNFITTLNSGDETIGDTKYYTIAGSGCIFTGIDGDGVVRSSSVPLEGATNYKINGQCSGFFNRDFHGELLNPSKYNEVLDYIKGILKE